MLILLTEVLRTLKWERKCASEFGVYRLKKYNVHRLIVRLYVFIGYFFLGVVFNQLMVDIGKYTIGRQRPHFMDVCKPSKGYNDCSRYVHEYITNFTCTGTDKYLIHESMLSFYSGHAAFSFYAAWYTTFYLQARLYRPLISRLVLPVIQFALFGGAAFVAYTRVSDYKHHWSDVLVGTAMGSAIGIINALFIAEVFEKREVPYEFRRAPRMLGYRRSLERRVRNSDDKFEEVERPIRERDMEKGNSSSSPTRVIVNEERAPSMMRPVRDNLQRVPPNGQNSKRTTNV